MAEMLPPEQQMQTPAQPGAEQAPVTEDEAPAPEEGQEVSPEMEGEGEYDFAASIEEGVSKLPDQMKQLLAMYLTPETTILMTSLFGEEIGSFFKKYEDPALILIPMDRQKAQEEIANQQQTQAAGPADMSGQGAPEAQAQAPGQAQQMQRTPQGILSA